MSWTPELGFPEEYRLSVPGIGSDEERTGLSATSVMVKGFDEENDSRDECIMEACKAGVDAAESVPGKE